MNAMACCPLSGTEHAEAATLCSTTHPTARKPHRCTECDEAIPAGAKYERTEGLWDGSWSTHKTCLSCVEIRDHFQCEGWIYGQLWEDLETNFFPEMRAGGPCMEGLSPEAKDRLFERRTKWLIGMNSRMRTEVAQ